MEILLSILILVPTAVVIIAGAALLLGTFAVLAFASLDGVIVGIRHRFHAGTSAGDMHYGTPALHH